MLFWCYISGLNKLIIMPYNAVFHSAGQGVVIPFLKITKTFTASCNFLFPANATKCNR
jgi:hypothetical protein